MMHGAVQKDAWGCVHTACVAQQCLHKLSEMIQKKQWSLNSPNLKPPLWETMHVALLKASFAAKNSF